MGSAEPRAPLAADPPPAEHGRTTGDVTSLLVELGRLVKGRQFYPDRHPQLREICERGFRAFEAEIRRAGPLDLEIRQGSFRLGSEPVGRGRVDDLAQDLVKRAVRRLRFDGALTPASLERFVSVLVTDPERLEQSGGFVRCLYGEACPGISVNEMDYAAALAQAGQPRGESGEAGAAGAGDAALGIAGLSEAGGVADGDGAALSALSALAGEKPDPAGHAQQLEQAPLDAENADHRASELIQALRELDAASDEAGYAALAGRVAVLGAALSDEGLRDEGYRAILVLASHAGDRSRSESLRRVALESLCELARGTRLDDLIDRSCAPGDGTGLRAAQILLRMGSAAVPALLRRVETEQDLDRRGQLYGILIAMGEAATAELSAAMRGGERRRAGVAVRLAGEMQNAGTVADLAVLLGHEDGDLRREAAKALVRVGSPEAIEALVKALESPADGMPGHAAFCLGVAGGHRALEVLVATVRRDNGRGDPDVVREAVRALGRMGRPEAAPELARVLARRALLRRRRLRELQLAAVSALAKLPGEAAWTALEQAAGRGPAEVREAARQALSRSQAEAPEHGAAGRGAPG